MELKNIVNVDVPDFEVMTEPTIGFTSDAPATGVSSRKTIDLALPYGWKAKMTLSPVRVKGENKMVFVDTEITFTSGKTFVIKGRSIRFHDGTITTYIDDDSMKKDFVLAAVETTVRRHVFKDANRTKNKVICSHGCDECTKISTFDGDAVCGLGMFDPIAIDGDEIKSAIHRSGTFEFNGAIYALGQIEANDMEMDISSAEMNPEQLLHALSVVVANDVKIGRREFTPDDGYRLAQMIDAAFPYDSKYNIRQEVADQDIIELLMEEFPLLEEILMGRETREVEPPAKNCWKLKFMGKLSDVRTLSWLKVLPDPGCIYGESRSHKQGGAGHNPRPFYENWLSSAVVRQPKAKMIKKEENRSSILTALSVRPATTTHVSTPYTREGVCLFGNVKDGQKTYKRQRIIWS